MSLRLRLTLAAGAVFAIALFGAGTLMIGIVEREAQASARDAIERSLADQANELAALGVSPGPVVPIGDGFAFGVFRRQGELAFGTMFINGESVATVELNLTTNRVNELFDPQTNEPISDPKLTAAADRLLLATRDLGAAGDEQVLVGAVSPRSVDVSTDAARRALWLSLPPVALFAIVLIWWIVGRALAPVAAITAQARQISTENLDERVPVPGPADEIGQLGATINAMLDRLEHGDAQRRRFSADVSHELRTPLTTIRAAGEVIVNYPERSEMLAPEIVDGADRLERIIDDLLTLAVLDQRAETPSEPVDLAAIARDSANEARRRSVDQITAQANTGQANTGRGDDVENDPVGRDVVEKDPAGKDSVEINVFAPDAVVVDGNEDQLRRAISNLISNAVRHAEHRIHVTIANRSNTITVVVEDDGPGVPADRRDEVFDRFVRLDADRSRDTGGAGLGLSLTKAVVESHIGTIEATASEVLGGARFAIELPARSAGFGSVDGERSERPVR